MGAIYIAHRSLFFLGAKMSGYAAKKIGPCTILGGASRCRANAHAGAGTTLPWPLLTLPYMCHLLRIEPSSLAKYSCGDPDSNWPLNHWLLIAFFNRSYKELTMDMLGICLFIFSGSHPSLFQPILNPCLRKGRTSYFSFNLCLAFMPTCFVLIYLFSL